LGTERIFITDLANFNDVMHAVTVADPDYVFHLGAVTQVTEARHWPIHTFRVNALGTMHVLEACRQLNKPDVKIIVASSDKAYGEPRESDLPLKEDVLLRPVHPYDVSKSSADLIAQSYARYFDMNIQITRMANVYGPGDINWKRLIPGFCRWALEERQGIIRSDGKQQRQYLYVADAIDAYYRLATRMNVPDFLEYGGTWNLGPPHTIAVEDVVKMVYFVADKHGYSRGIKPLILGEAQDETPVMAIDSSKALNAMLWMPQTDLQSGLAWTLQWMEGYLADRGRIVP
jgi:CDP-glucose 4,6-dehydratase